MNAAYSVLRGMAAGLVALLVTSTVAVAQVDSYPYTNGFESDTIGAKPAPYGTTWTTNGDGAVYVTNNTSAAGSKSCHIFSDALNLNTSYSTRSNVWLRIFCKPTAYDDAGGAQPSAANCSAAFYLSTSGVLYAYADTNGLVTGGGNGWTNVASGIPTNQWLGFVVHLDYFNQLWDLYYTTGSTGATMTKAYSAPLLMSTQHSNRLWQVTVSSGGTSYVDEVSIANAYTELSSGSASPTNVQYLYALTVSRGMGARTIAKYFGPTSDTLTQELGDVLTRVLNENDQIRLFFSDRNQWGIYSNKLTYWSWKSDPSGKSPANTHITHTTGFWLDDTTATGTVNVVGFAPYNTTDPTNTTVYGSATAGGWNLFQWPYSARSVNGTPGLGFASAGAGDLIFIYDEAKRKYVRLWYKAGTGWMQGGNAPSSYVLQEGQGFWYKRAAADDVWWTIESVK